MTEEMKAEIMRILIYTMILFGAINVIIHYNLYH